MGEYELIVTEPSVLWGYFGVVRGRNESYCKAFNSPFASV